MKTIVLYLIVVMHASAVAQPSNPDALLLYKVRASDTDPAITWEAARHYVWLNPSATPKNTLLLFLGGTYSTPAGTTLFPELAANNGYHVISLYYPNDIAARAACEQSADAHCYENFRKEIIEGYDYSPYVEVDSANCIQNRLLKLLVFLHDQQPQEGWQQFYDTAVQWGTVVVAGHSQGGGHAALIAKEHKVQRVLMFASPNDYSLALNEVALWVSQPSATPPSAYYSFGNLYDDVVNFAEQYQVWSALQLRGMGDTVEVNATPYPFGNTHMLYTTDTTAGVGGNHGNTIRDASTPRDTQGVPKYDNVWRYLLGIEPLTAAVQNDDTAFPSTVRVYPNPVVGGNAYLEFTDNTGGVCDIVCTDVIGRQCISIPYGSHAGVNKVPLPRVWQARGIWTASIRRQGEILGAVLFFVQ